VESILLTADRATTVQSKHGMVGAVGRVIVAMGRMTIGMSALVVLAMVMLAIGRMAMARMRAGSRLGMAVVMMEILLLVGSSHARPQPNDTGCNGE
jgi:hypothetical protein